MEKTLRATQSKRDLTFAPDVVPLLVKYRWPGNVRELENAIERAVVLARGNVVTREDLPEAVRRSEGDPGLQRRPVIRFEVGQSLETLEREAISRTLEAVGGKREVAASILGIGLATLYRRLREMGDDVEPGDAADDVGSKADGRADGQASAESDA